MRFRTHKYHAKPVDGFASTKERNRYVELKLLETSGAITELELQPRFPLLAGIVYIADFRYKEKGQVVVEDVKGYQTREFQLKAKLFKHCYPTIDFRIV